MPLFAEKGERKQKARYEKRVLFEDRLLLVRLLLVRLLLVRLLLGRLLSDRFSSADKGGFCGDFYMPLTIAFAAIAPSAHAVTTCRSDFSLTSPTANTPSISVCIFSSVTI